MIYQFPFFGDMHNVKLKKEEYPNGSLCLSVAVYNKAYDSFDVMLDLSVSVPLARKNHVFINLENKEQREFVFKELVQTGKLRAKGTVLIGNVLLHEYKVTREFLEELEREEE